MFREFVSELLATQGVEAPSRSIPAAVAHALASAGEAAWRLLPLPGRPPLTRFAYWVSAQECTIRIDKAREQLGYAPVKGIPDGLAELRADWPAPRLPSDRLPVGVLGCTNLPGSLRTRPCVVCSA